jgi:hypothetical protein
VKIQGEAQVVGRLVRDCDGRSLGRVVAVECAPDPYTATWFVLRLPGWRRQLRAVPASRAAWHGAGTLSVPCPRAVVVQSPPLSRDELRSGLVRGDLEAHFLASGVGGAL